MAFSTTPRWATNSASRRASSRFTARILMPQASSQVIRRSVAPPWTAHSRSRSMANNSRAVTWPPGSAQGIRIWFTPWVGHSSRDLSLDPDRELAGIQVAPAAGYLVVPRDGCLTLRTEEGTVPCGHGHRDLLSLDVQVHAGDTLRRGEAENCPVKFHIAHGSSHPFRGRSRA